MAMGVTPELARGSVRVSLGRETTAAEIRDFLSVLTETVFQLGRLAALAG
jgi:cysteine desulfurase